MNRAPRRSLMTDPGQIAVPAFWPATEKGELPQDRWHPITRPAIYRDAVTRPSVYRDAVTRPGILPEEA